MNEKLIKPIKNHLVKGCVQKGDIIEYITPMRKLSRAKVIGLNPKTVKCIDLEKKIRFNAHYGSFNIVLEDK